MMVLPVNHSNRQPAQKFWAVFARCLMCNDGMGLLVITGWCFGIFLSLPLSLALYIPPISILFSVIISILQIFCHGALQPPAPKKISDRFQSWRPWMNSARTSLRRSPDVTGSTKTQYTIHPFSRILAEFFLTC